MNRRGFFRSAGALVLAPAVVKAEHLMPVRRIVAPELFVASFVPGGHYFTPDVWSREYLKMLDNVILLHSEQSYEPLQRA